MLPTIVTAQMTQIQGFPKEGRFVAELMPCNRKPTHQHTTPCMASPRWCPDTPHPTSEVSNPLEIGKNVGSPHNLCSVIITIISNREAFSAVFSCERWDEAGWRGKKPKHHSCATEGT